jgi:hypothetical protein
VTAPKTMDPRVHQVDECPLPTASGYWCGAVEVWESNDGKWVFELLGSEWVAVRRQSRHRVYSASRLDEAIAMAYGEPQ